LIQQLSLDLLMPSFLASFVPLTYVSPVIHARLFRIPLDRQA